MEIRKVFIVRCLVVVIIVVLHSSSFAFDDTELIDIPTANVLPRANYSLNFRFWHDGGLLLQGIVGARDKLNMGLSYGAGNVIGEGEPNWNQDAKINIKYKLFESGQFMPAVAIGYDSQGQGNYLKDKRRFERKSKGFFAVASKEFFILTSLRLHAGLNKSLEDEDDHKELNYFFGADCLLNPEFLVMADYDMRLNEEIINDKKDRGDMNAGLRWYFLQELSLEFDFLNLLENNANIQRIAKIIYTGVF